MHLLYADESGSVADPKQRFFVLAGISIFERQGYWIGKKMDEVASRFNPDEPGSMELHASPMFHGKKNWRRFHRDLRVQAIKDCLQVFAESHSSNIMFACVVRKSLLNDKDIVEYSFEQLATRFDYYLSRLYKTRGDNQRGILIFDKSTYENTLQNLANTFRNDGHSWGYLRNFSEVPLFLESKVSRLIQLADIVAYALFRHYEEKDDQFYEIIAKRWDKHAGVTHGLYERIV